MSTVKLCRYLAVFTSCSVLVTGCTKLYRENIISSVNSGVGLTGIIQAVFVIAIQPRFYGQFASFAENPQTELYELKAGYIRSQYYSIPTGKLVLKNDGGKSNDTTTYDDTKTENHPDITPTLVSGIRVTTSVQNLFLGMDISENFAVGAAGVNSPAASAMFISQSQDSGVAGAAATAASDVANKVPAAARTATPAQ